jgi:hypothetical protein
MRRFWHDYNLSIVLAALFVASWLAQTWSASRLSSIASNGG